MVTSSMHTLGSARLVALSFALLLCVAPGSAAGAPAAATEAQVAPLPTGTLSIVYVGRGAVGVSPAGIVAATGRLATRCDDTTADARYHCTFRYVPGTVVALTPLPDVASGSALHRWGALACLGRLTCPVRVGASAEAAVTFTPLQLGIAVSGEGRVRSVTPGIDCADVCRRAYPARARVLLQADSAEPVDWMSGCEPVAGRPDRCVATVAGDPHWVGVRFGDAAAPAIPGARVVVDFRILHGGDGRGRVRGAGIDCGATCTVRYTFGDRERLVAQPNVRSRFRGWRGTCGSRPVCRLSVGPVTSVRAVFAPRAGDGSPRGRRLAVTDPRAAAHGRGRRREVVFRAWVNRRAQARLVLVRGRRVVAQRVFRLRSGGNRLRLRVPARARSGRHTLTLRVRSGRQLEIVRRAVRLRS